MTRRGTAAPTADLVPFTSREQIRAALPRVLSHLAGDGLIAYPTETVYSCRAADAQAP